MSLLLAALFAPLLVSADSGFSVRDEAASFIGDAGGQFERRLRDEVLFGESALDFSEWLKLRGVAGFDRVVTQRLLSGGVDYVEGLGFVRDVEVRYESPLGERAGNFGVAALGSLRESADDIIAWELRGYLAEQSAAGANVGVAYRRLVRDNLLAGVNAFLDYERTDNDGDFWRWSAGVEAMSERIDFNANVYLALSDAVMTSPGGTAYRVYSADGWDAELSGRLPFAEWVEVAARYYSWAGDGGDEDKDGARLRLGFHPQPQIRFGLEYDSGDGDGAGNKNLGYYFNFRHRLGSAADSVARGDGDTRVGDVWSRRFDPVRREHKQNIRRVEATATNTSAEKFLSDFEANGAVLTLSSYFPAGAGYSYAVVSANPANYANLVSVVSVTAGVVEDRGAKNANGNGTVYFSVTDSTGGVSLEFTVFFRNLAFADSAIDLTLSSLDTDAEVVTLQATRGAGGYVYALVSANPPAFAAGLQLSNSVVIDNGAAAGGAAQGVVVYSATDADDVRVFATVSVVVLDDLSIAENDITVFLQTVVANAPVVTLDVAGGLAPLVYAIESATPSGLLAIANGVVSDSGAKNTGGGGVAVFSVTDANGMAVRATVKFSDIAVANDVVSVNLGAAAANAALLTLSASGGVAPLTYAVHSATPSNWAGLLPFGSGANNNVVTDNGVVDDGRAGVVVFSVADDNGVEVFVTARFGNLMVSDTADVILTSRDNNAAVLTLAASGGDGFYTYAFESINPADWLSGNSVSINPNSGIITDNGVASAGAATATLVYSATDGDGYAVTATVVVVVLADVGVTDGDITLTLNPGDNNSGVLTITATGGDGAYAYTWESSGPASWRSNNSLVLSTVGGELVITDNGAAVAGAAMATLEFSATDGNGFTSATATVRIEVLEAVVFAEDNIMLTLSSVDANNPVLTLTASGTTPYNFELVSADPSGSEVSLSTAGSGAEFVITDNGIASGGAATATLEYKVTDANNTEATATIHFVVVDDLSVVNNSISLALDIDDAGDAVATLTTAGGVAPLTFAIVSSNPDETLLAINSDGVISEAGLHSIGGGGTVEFSVTDAKGMVANATLEYSYTAVKFSARSHHTALTLNNKIFIIGGSDGTNRLNDVWSSADGINWSLETANAGFLARERHSSAVLNGVMYVIGGDAGGAATRLNDVWSSTDGATWIQVTSMAAFAGRIDHSSTALSGTLYVIGGIVQDVGVGDDVWYSTDGENWMLHSSTALPGRYAHSSVVSNGMLYALGGRGITFTRINDVWSSANGSTWTDAGASSHFSVRENFSLVALNGEIYAIGGQDNVGLKNDVWSSTDGMTWTEETSVANFTVRSNHDSVIFNNRIYVLGGSDGTNRLNDVWSSPDGTTWTQH